MSETIVFATECYRYLQSGLCRLGSYRLGEVATRRFPDGECHMRLTSGIEGHDVVVLGTTLPGDHFMELYDLSSGLVSYGARSLTVIIPYFAYSTMERVVKVGDVVTAKNRARVLSALPQADWNNRVVMLDLHSEGIPHYFEGPMRPAHMTAKKLILKLAKELAGDNFVLASTDAGRAKWVESWARELGVDPAFVLKKRLGDRETKVVAPASPINNRAVVIYDDMIRSGSSLIEAARSYKAAGASLIYGITTHGIFTDGALAKLQASGLFKKIICSDSYPGNEKRASEFLQVYSIAPLIKEYLDQRSV